MNKETESALNWIIGNKSAYRMAHSMRHHPDDLADWFGRVFQAFDELRNECHSLMLIDFESICKQLNFD